jgi:hypothetical protein
MLYSKAFEQQMSSLRKLLLDKISYKIWKKEYNKTQKSYKIIFESDNFKEFSKMMYNFFNDKELVKKRLAHEKRHANINKKYGLKSRFILKGYKRGGKKKYRPSVLDAKEDKKASWPKRKLWKYYYDQTSMKDASDNDKKIRNMLLKIKESLQLKK